MASLGRYTIKGTIGRGGSGVVYLGRREDLDRQVAIKALHQQLAADEAFRAAFREEARILAGINHPNVVELYEFIEGKEEAYIVGEYVDGLSLRKVVSHAGRLTPEQALGVLKGALSGLGHAHASGLVHQDVKPDNILVDRAATSKLVDFGQARRLDDDAAPRFGGLSSPAYMSPEHCQGQPVDRRSDLYSAGILLYELLTGHLPYSGGAAQVLRQHVSAPVPDPRLRAPELPRGVAEVVVKALAKNPADRFQDADSFLLALETAAREGYGADWESRASLRRVVAAALGGAGALAGISGVLSGVFGGLSGPLAAGAVLAAVAGGLGAAYLAHNLAHGTVTYRVEQANGRQSGPGTSAQDVGAAPGVAGGIPASSPGSGLGGVGVVNPAGATGIATNPPQPGPGISLVSQGSGGGQGSAPGATGGPAAAGGNTGGAGSGGSGAGSGTGSGTGSGSGSGTGSSSGSTNPHGGQGGPLPTTVDIPPTSLAIDYAGCASLPTAGCGSSVPGGPHASASSPYQLQGSQPGCVAAQGYVQLQPVFDYFFHGSRQVPVSLTWTVSGVSPLPTIKPIVMLLDPNAAPGSGAGYTSSFATGLFHALFQLTWVDDAGAHGPISSPPFYWSC